MDCPSCGEANRSDRLYCARCGGALAGRCGARGTKNEPGERFCGKCGASLGGTPAPPAAEAVPTSFASDRYRVRRLLGEGGRKRVYLATDTRLERDVALALVKTEGLADAGVARVHREARAMGRLGDHPHIVTVHDVGEEAGQPYIVSQYIARSGPSA
jgi:serine/threonine protein kinase